MSTETRSETATESGIALEQWQAGVLGGIVGAVAFGLLLITSHPGRPIEVAMPTMYGFSPNSGAIGFAIHLAHGAVLGVVFAALVELSGLRATLDDNLKLGLAGLVWGLVTWVLLAALLMPVWLDAVGSPASPPFPNFATDGATISLVGHAVFGVVLGIVYSVTAKA